MRRAVVVCLAATAVPALAFVPTTGVVSYGQRGPSQASSCLAHRSKGVMGLRASDRFERPDIDEQKKINLGTTKTSWQGWGSSTQSREKPKIVIDALNTPEMAVKEALLRARELDDIAKFLGTSESKQRAGITGDVEFVSLNGSELVLRLTGNFWHNRQMVFDEVTNFIKKVLPMGTVSRVSIEDPAQLNGFAETSNAFKDQAQITDEQLRNREAKGTNIYGEKLEGPAAEFRRRKIANQAKYDELMANEREMAKKDDGQQIQEILEQEGLASMFGGGSASKTVSRGPTDENLRPEDILKSMM